MAYSGRVPRTHPSQWATLVDFVERHPEMVTHKFVGMNGRENFNKLWEDLSVELNSMGFGMKESKKWQELFGKWKSKVKMKAQEIICKAQKTGAGGFEGPLPQLSPVEERLMALIGWKIITGDENKEMGVENDFHGSVEEPLAVNTNAEERASSSARRLLVPLQLCKNARTLISPLPGTSKISALPSTSKISPVPGTSRISPFPGSSKQYFIPSPELDETSMEDVSIDMPPLIAIKKKTLESAPIGPIPHISLNNEDTEVGREIRGEITIDNTPKILKTTRNRKFLQTSTKSTSEAKNLSEMHNESMNMLKDINTNLSRLADSHEKQTKIMSEFLDILKTKL